MSAVNPIAKKSDNAWFGGIGIGSKIQTRILKILKNNNLCYNRYNQANTNQTLVEIQIFTNPIGMKRINAIRLR